MKKISLICAVALAGLSLTACGSNSTKKASSSSKVTSSKVVKHHSKRDKHSSSSSVSSDNQQGQQQSSQQAGQQTQASSNQGQPASSNGVDSADSAVAAARAKYGDQNGYIHWGYMIDGTTGQPIRNDDGSYFVKGTADDGTMTGTQYSLNVYPDGSITSN